MITAVDCTIVRFDPSQILPKFFNFYSQSCEYLKGLDSKTTGTTRKRISKSKLGQAPIPVPPLPEQHRIVAILDKAFNAIATANANTEKNLRNARALFENHLRSMFSHHNLQAEQAVPTARSFLRSQYVESHQADLTDPELEALNAGYATKTGGRLATLRHIPGQLSLSVCMPRTAARRGWRWSALADLARLESGHTPSRKHPEYWGGSVPWIGIQDARAHHGRTIKDTLQKTNEMGIANSSARVLPKGTVCVSRTASVGYVVVMDRPMATSQDFVNWVCSKELHPDFLKYLFLAEGREGFLRYASGSVHPTIYFPEAKAFHICHPITAEQIRIVNKCDALLAETQRLESAYKQKLASLDALKKSLLHRAFAGQLTTEIHATEQASVAAAFSVAISNITTTDLHAGILALACAEHETHGKLAEFTHVKAEKTAHMIEAHLGIDLGRKPVKDAAGPNDFPHLKKVEHRARKMDYFDFKQVDGRAYRIQKLSGFDRLLDKTRTALGERLSDVQGLLQWMLPLNVQQTEIVATVYAAWNNLLLDGKTPTDEEIVHESRENWHPDKLKIARTRFFSAVQWLRAQRVVPDGKGKRVEKKPDSSAARRRAKATPHATTRPRSGRGM
jgi:restriction endonuclease S subunit